MRNAQLPAVAALALSLACAASGQSWNHNPNSQIGPPFWGSVTPSYATCGNTTVFANKFVEVGQTQTPIDIATTKASLAQLPRLEFNYDDTPLAVQNTGHVIQVNYATGSYLRFGKAVTDLYQLNNFHFHVPSEHTIDGKSYDGELHLDHVNQLGEKVIVTVFLSRPASGSGTAGIYDDVVSNSPTTVATNTVKGRTVNATDLLPSNTRVFYTYAGSGTTPPCAEGVRRIVLAKPVTVTPYVIQQLHTLVSGFPDYGGYSNNNRPVAPLNSRTVMVVR